MRISDWSSDVCSSDLEDTPVDIKGLAKRLGVGTLSFGKPELLWERLGVVPGSVTPFALINDPERQVSPVLEARMMDIPLLNYHPLRNDRTTAKIGRASGRDRGWQYG